MPEDTTVMLTKAGVGPVQSKIWNTSVRGLIALILSGALALCFFLVVIAPYFKVEVPVNTATAVITLFAAAITAAVNHYFEGEKQKLIDAQNAQKH